MEKPLILIDGSSYLYRAYHALPPLMTSKGQPTGAIYGVITMIKKLLHEYQPDHIAVIFDAKGKTFRHDLYEPYKANRAVMPEELQTQIAPLHEIIQAMGLPLIMQSGVEADDIIGTLAHLANQHNHPVLISTGDKDMAQLVNKNIRLINTMSNTIMDEQGVFEKFGVHPHQIIDYLTLIGDTSDNVPGVPGVGPKTAAKWLKQYETLDNIIKHHQEIPGKIQGALTRHLPEFELMKKLIIIKTDLDLNINILTDFNIHNNTKTATKNYDHEKLMTLFTQLEFKNWIIQPEKPEKFEKQKNYQGIFTQAELDNLIIALNKTAVFAVDTETTSLNIINAEIVGLSFAFTVNTLNQAFYIPLKHNYIGAPAQLNREAVLNQLKPLLENPHTIKIGHNLKYDINIFRNHDIHIQGLLYDTMLESYILDSTASRHDMDSVAKKYLDYKTISFEDIAGKGSKQITFNQVDIQTAIDYAAEDADITLQLHHTLWSTLEQDAELATVFNTIEMPLVSILADIERRGVLIDADLLKHQSDDLTTRIKAIENQVYALTDRVFNLASPKQLQDILYQHLQLPILEKTPLGQPSTGESVLQELALQYEFPRLILQHRTLSKLKSTYTDKLPLEINAKTQRIHTSYHQAGTSTGRLSSSHPNLQNIPIKTEEGRKIRQAFIASKHHIILSADYSQIELRLMAHLSQDANLVHAFKQGLDIHRATAADIFNSAVNEVTSEQRRYAKTINFGLIYGMSAFGLAKQLGIEREAAQNYINTYFNRYPGVKSYMEKTKSQAHEKGFVQTLSGRKLYLPEINSRNMMRQKGAERAAINAPLQGSAADLIKLAMIALKNLPIIMQVHDELVFEIPENTIDEAKQHIKTCMENIMPFLSVPLEVTIGIGPNWDEAH